MDALLRVVRKSPTVAKSRHKKLGEGWGENKEPVKDGMTFYMKYLGSTLVEELPDDESYGDGISGKAVQSIVTMAKTAGKKLKKVSLTISPNGIRMMDLVTQEVAFDLSVYRISFCTADKAHDKVFAFIARNSINETMECHAYFCAKKKLAQAITLTVSQAFALAEEKWDNSQNNSKVQKDIANHHKASNNENMNRTHSVIKPLPSNTSSIGSTQDAFTGTLAPPPANVTSGHKQSAWQEFSDDEDLEDDFSRLAENRGRRLPSFSTDLRQEDCDESVHQYMDGQRCFEEFSRQKSIEDLLNL